MLSTNYLTYWQFLALIKSCYIWYHKKEIEIIPRFEAVFANPGNAFRLCGIDNEFAGTCFGLPSEPRIVTKPPNVKGK